MTNRCKTAKPKKKKHKMMYDICVSVRSSLSTEDNFDVFRNLRNIFIQCQPRFYFLVVMTFGALLQTFHGTHILFRCWLSFIGIWSERTWIWVYCRSPNEISPASCALFRQINFIFWPKQTERNMTTSLQSWVCVLFFIFRRKKIIRKKMQHISVAEKDNNEYVFNRCA